MRFDRIEGLVDKLKGEVESEGWFQWEAPLAMLVKGQRAPAREQTSVVRTNCAYCILAQKLSLAAGATVSDLTLTGRLGMDSLDRTNVLQSALARSMLDLQLRSLSLLGPNESIAQYAEFAHAFRSAWADHADAVSTMYSGTGALKTDFTRTGRRTWRGALEDGRRSLVRYWKNNFSDGERQVRRGDVSLELVHNCPCPKLTLDPNSSRTRLISSPARGRSGEERLRPL